MVEPIAIEDDSLREGSFLKEPLATTPLVTPKIAKSRPVDPAGDEPLIWPRIRHGYALPQPDDSRIDREVDWLQRHPDYLSRVSERAKPYLFHIMEEVEIRGLPLELALLPIVESAFQPFAYSPGRASGIWQFIPATGRRYGLKQNWWYDGRRDITASTKAALDYLQALYDQFDGNWLHALAAYNCGEGNVHKAIRRNQRKAKPTDFWHLKLPRETKSYVPRLLAVAKIIADPGQYGVELAPIDNRPYLELVETDGQIDLALAADLAGLSLDELYRLNPGYNRWATDPKGPHYLLLPITRAEEFRHRLTTIPNQQRVHWERHKIRNGETLIHIARRYHTTVKVLKESNHLRNSRIRAGHSLTVPVAVKSLDKYLISANSRRKDPRSQFVPRAKTANTILPGGTTRKVRYTVRNGESLWKISQRFKVSIVDLREWNRLREGKYLQPGQKLNLYVDITRQGENI